MKKLLAMLLVVATILALAAPVMATEPEFPSYDDETSYYPIDPNAEAVFDFLSRAGFYKLSYELSTSDLQELLDKVATYRKDKEESKENVGTNLLWKNWWGNGNVTVEGLESDTVTLKVNINDLTVDNTKYNDMNKVCLNIVSNYGEGYSADITYSDKEALDALYPQITYQGNQFTFDLTNLSAGTYIVAIPVTYYQVEDPDEDGVWTKVEGAETYTQILYVTIIVECTHENADKESLVETKTVKKASLFDSGYGYTYCSRCGKIIENVKFPSYWDTLGGRITIFKALETLISSIAAKLAGQG